MAPRMLLLLLLAAAMGDVAVAAARPGLGRPPPETCLTSQHGAEPSETQAATAGLQAAIDACSDRCGTVVVDLPGQYLTGALRLSGCINLQLPDGVTLLASERREDYPAQQADWYLLQFNKCDKCSLTGGGTIDGRGRKWLAYGGEAAAARRRLAARGAGPDAVLAVGGEEPLQAAAVHNWRDPSCAVEAECRPRLLGVVDSGDVKVAGVRLSDPVYHGLHILNSVRVVVAGVSISGSWELPNNNGIVVDGSRYVTVRNVDISTADSAITLQSSTPKGETSHVTVTDARLKTRATAVKVGDVSRGPLRFLTFTHITALDSHRGLAIVLRDGGDVSHVAFRSCNISTRLFHPDWEGAGEPIYVTALPRDPQTKVGTVTDVQITDVTASGENGIFIAGGPVQVPPGPVPRSLSLSGITLQRVSLKLVKRSVYPGGCQDYRPSQGAGEARGEGGAHWPSGLDCSAGSTAPLWVSGAERVLLADVHVEHGEPWRLDWRRGAWVDSYSTRAVQQIRVTIS